MNSKSLKHLKNSSEADTYIKAGKEALWYREWAKANHLFTQVLSADEQNPKANFGFKLAQSQCRDLDELIRQRKKLISDKKYSYETLFIDSQSKEKIDSAIRELTNNDVLSEKEILAAFYPALEPAVRLKITEKIIAEENDFWENDEYFMRIRNSGDDELKEMLSSAYADIKSMLDSETAELQKADKNFNKDTEKGREVCSEAFRQAHEYLLSRHQENLTLNYNNAVQMQDESISQYGYQNAERNFRKLGEFKDAASRADACPVKADEIIEKKRIDAQKKRRRWIIAVASVLCAALAAVLIYFTEVKLVLPPKNYKKGLEALENGDKKAALCYFDKTNGYSDSEMLAMPLRKEQAQNSVVDAAGLYTIAIKDDGTVAATGILPQTSKYSSGPKVEEWKDIISVAANWDHTIGLKSDGTVVAVGENIDGKCNVEDWSDIIAVDAGGNHTVGLRSDGSVVATGSNSYGQCDVSEWDNIISVAAGASHTVGLKSDGTVVATGKNTYPELGVRYRRDQFSKGHKFSEHKPCNVGSWKDIVAISAGAAHTVGLKADGTVVAVGFNGYAQCEIRNWRDVTAISAGDYLTMGLLADGTVKAIGWNSYKECFVKEMENITAISAGFWHTVGIRADGTAIAIGNNKYEQCEVGSWKGIRIPEYN